MNNYIEQATRTESLDLFKVDSPRLLHAAIGVTTETAELLLATDNTNVKEELGDICWYLAIACDQLDITFDQLTLLGDVFAVTSDVFKSLLGSSADALDVVKRGLFYGIELDEAKLGRHLGTVLLAVISLAQDNNWSLGDLQEANIGKLSTRYPEKFTSEAAVNRDIAAEMEAVGT